MKRMGHKKRSMGQMVTGMLIGSVAGALVGWLTATTSRGSLGRRLTGGGTDPYQSVREKLKTADGNVESRARDLAAETNDVKE